MLEHILRFSLAQRHLVFLFTLAVAGFGVYSFQRLPIDAVPDITNRQVQINTEYASFSPDEVEKQITFPIETALSGIPGLDHTRSLSRNGFSQVTAVFHDNVDVFFARQQVGERLAEARENLPPGSEPKMGPIATGLGEVYMWTVEYIHPKGEGAKKIAGAPGWQPDGSYLTPEGQRLKGEVELATYLREAQDWIIRPRVKEIPGVAGVDAIGGYVKQYDILPDPSKLQSFGLTFQDVIEALERNNVSAGAGYIEHKGEAYAVRAAGRIESAGQIGEIPLGARRGTAIHVHDVASVGVGRELRTGSASEDGNEAVVGTAVMLMGENSRTVAAAADEKIKEINKNLPPDIRAKPVLDRGKLVNATIETVRKNLIEGAVLVIAVLFCLLGNFRAAFLTALVIPLSMLMAFTGMVQMKISGNLMSLGAIDFGIIVDGAIIIVENYLRMLAEKQQEEGRVLTLRERLPVVFQAARQVQTATLYGIAIIIIVYLPILALTGVEGKMFRPMAVTVIFALAAAFVVSQTFVPAMAAIFITGRVSEKDSFFMRIARRAYAPVVAGALRHRYIVVLAASALFAGSLLLFTRLGQEFAPALDEKDVLIQSLRVPSVSLTQSTKMQLEIEKSIRQFPEVLYVFSKTGTAEIAADPMPPNVSDTFIIFKPRPEWPDPGESKADITGRLEAVFQKHPGHNYEVTQPIQMRFNELISGVRSDVAVKVVGDDFEILQKTAARVAGVLRAIPGAADVKVEQTEGLPAMNVKVNWPAVSRLGINAAEIIDIVSIAVGGREAGVVFEGDRRFDMVVKLPEGVRQDPFRLESMLIPIPSQGEGGADKTGFIPLGEVADVEITEGRNQISRENGKRLVVAQANVRGRDIGSFVEEAQWRMDSEVEVPPGYWLDWGGQFENLVAARQRLSIVAPVCLFLIFLLLFSALGSVRHALLVFTGVPLALTGGIAALWLRGIPFSMSAAVGFIALSGVAVLNGIVMVSFINQLRRDGVPLDAAVVQGSLARLRPVLMTALVASLGFIPMALATGAGAEVQKPLATVVIGGLVSSTLLTLLVLPVLYKWFSAKTEYGLLPDSGEDEITV